MNRQNGLWVTISIWLSLARWAWLQIGTFPAFTRPVNQADNKISPHDYGYCLVCNCDIAVKRRCSQP